jgi:hypothetical protein
MSALTSAAGQPVGWPAPAMPAIGRAGLLARRALRRRLVVGAVLVALGASVFLGSRQLRSSDSVPPPLADLAQVSIADQLPAPPVLRGGVPTDVDLVKLAEQDHVGAVINVGGANIEERAVARQLHLSYLELPIEPSGVPSARQLSALETAVHRARAAGQGVYLHDEAGGGRVVTIGIMLSLLSSRNPAATLDAVPAAQWSTMSGRQLLAVRSMAATRASDAR